MKDQPRTAIRACVKSRVDRAATRSAGKDVIRIRKGGTLGYDATSPTVEDGIYRVHTVAALVILMANCLIYISTDPVFCKSRLLVHGCAKLLEGAAEMDSCLERDIR